MLKRRDLEGRQCLPSGLRRDYSLKGPSKGRVILSRKCAMGSWALISTGYLFAF